MKNNYMKEETLKRIRDLHEILLEENAKPNYRGRVLSLAITKLEECEMWYSREVPKVQEAPEDLPLLRMMEANQPYEIRQIETGQLKEINKKELEEAVNKGLCKPMSMHAISATSKESYDKTLNDLKGQKLTCVPLTKEQQENLDIAVKEVCKAREEYIEEKKNIIVKDALVKKFAECAKKKGSNYVKSLIAEFDCSNATTVLEKDNEIIQQILDRLN